MTSFVIDARRPADSRPSLPIPPVFTQHATTLQGVNLLVRRLKPAASYRHALQHLQSFAEQRHCSLRSAATDGQYPYDVRLRLEVMQALRGWRSSLSASP